MRHEPWIGEVCNLLMDQSALSHHLGVLRKARIVQTTKDGKCIHYTKNYERLSQLGIIAEGILKGVGSEAGV